jgi:hypothetical protein
MSEPAPDPANAPIHELLGVEVPEAEDKIEELLTDIAHLLDDTDER